MQFIGFHFTFLLTFNLNDGLEEIDYGTFGSL